MLVVALSPLVLLLSRIIHHQQLALTRYVGRPASGSKHLHIFLESNNKRLALILISDLHSI